MGREARSHLNYTSPSIDRRYVEQQRWLDEMAKENGWVCFRPDYHAKDRDCNTVMIYTREDEEYNRAVEARGESDFYIAGSRYSPYRDPFFVFENTDINGMGSLEFANYGTIDLRWLCWKTRLEGAVKLALAKRMQDDYIGYVGGVLNLREADDIYNDFNRQILEAYRMRCGGRAYIGKFNCTDEPAPLLEYVGQRVYNFDCDFIVPTEDAELIKLIKENSESVSVTKIEAIQERINALKGENFLWK